MLAFEEFEDYYETHNLTLPDERYNSRKHKLNKKQLERKYSQYQRRILREEEKLKEKLEKQYNKDMEYKQDEKWEEVKSKLNLKRCLLVDFLIKTNQKDLLNELKRNAGPLLKIIDPAHVFPRSGYPYLKYDEDNIIPLNRFSHSMLDQGRDPIFGDRISQEMVKMYWKAFIRDKKYPLLENKIKKEREWRN